MYKGKSKLIRQERERRYRSFTTAIANNYIYPIARRLPVVSKEQPTGSSTVHSAEGEEGAFKSQRRANLSNKIW